MGDFVESHGAGTCDIGPQPWHLASDVGLAKGPGPDGAGEWAMAQGRRAWGIVGVQGGAQGGVPVLFVDIRLFVAPWIGSQ